MVGGQVDDLAWESDQPGERTLELLERLHLRKTGALFRAALRMGVYAAHANKERPDAALLERFDAYGRCLGLAFQITDDLLDLADEGTEEQKLTFPALLGVDASRQRARELIDGACAAVAVFGPRAVGLDGLARYVLERSI